MGSVPGAGATVPCPAMDTDGMTGLCFIDHHLHPHIALPTMGEYVSLDYLVLVLIVHKYPSIVKTVYPVVSPSLESQNFE